MFFPLTKAQDYHSLCPVSDSLVNVCVCQWARARLTSFLSFSLLLSLFSFERSMNTEREIISREAQLLLLVSLSLFVGNSHLWRPVSTRSYPYKPTNINIYIYIEGVIPFITPKESHAASLVLKLFPF